MNQKVININKIDLLQLKRHLNTGDIKRIAEKTGYSHNYVSRVLNPHDKRMNKKIITQALKIASEAKFVPVPHNIEDVISA